MLACNISRESYYNNPNIQQRIDCNKSCFPRNQYHLQDPSMQPPLDCSEMTLPPLRLSSYQRDSELKLHQNLSNGQTPQSFISEHCYRQSSHSSTTLATSPDRIQQQKNLYIASITSQNHSDHSPAYGSEPSRWQEGFSHYHHHLRTPISDSNRHTDVGRARRTRRVPVHVSVVGSEGYPPPAPRCLKRRIFTAEDDRKLKTLKEQYDLTWRQIQEFFPGRGRDTLQVRYCTKLKDGLEIQWTPSLDSKLRNYAKDYRARIHKAVASKMGHNFTPQMCEYRMRELGICERYVTS